MPRFSANLGFLWPDRPLLDRIAAASDAGFRAVELHWPYDVPAEAVRSACESRGLELLGLNTAVGDASKGDSGLAAVPGRERDFAAAMQQSIAYCVATGAKMIHAMAGVVTPAQREVATGVFKRNIRSAAEAAAENGLTLLLEPLNARDKPDYFYAGTDRVVELIGEIDRPNVKLLFDIYHCGVSEGDILKRLERHMPVTGHVQIAAVPSRGEPDEGEIAYDRVLRAVDALGYQGWIGCEYRPRGKTEEGLGWVQAFGFSL
jgi:hydroxypyruvate isomerase